MARDDEDHTGGIYTGKRREEIAVLQVLVAFLDATDHAPAPPAQPGGMTQEEAEALAVTIKSRLPQAEVETRATEDGLVWEVVAHNPRCGTSQVVHGRQEFEELMERSARR